MARAHRKLLFRMHAWIGLNLGLLLFIVCFSGTVAVFSHELSWLADPTLRVNPPQDAERKRLSWQQLYDRVTRAYPYAMVLYLSAPRGDRWPARAVIGYAGHDRRSVLIDPYTGAVKGLKSSFGVVSFLRIFHKQLYIVPSVLRIHGTLIVGTLAIVLLAAATTGLLSLKRWQRAFLTLRRGRSSRLFWSDLHRITGLWALVVTIFLAVTGIWYLAERVLQDSGVLVEDARPAPIATDELRRRPATRLPLDLDRAAALAQAAYPELVIADIALPARPADPIVFSGQAEAWLVRDRANQVRMDPYTGAILVTRRATELAPFDRWIDTADPLHFGTFGGLATRIIWFAAGLMLCTGILAGLHGARLRQRARRRGAPRRGMAAAAVSTAPTLALLAAAAYGTWAYGGDALRSAQQAIRITPLMAGTLGLWRVSAVRFIATDAPAGQIEVAILFEGKQRPNFAAATLQLARPGEPATTLRVRRFADRLLAQVPCPADAGPGACRLHLTIEEWTGARHTLQFDPRMRAASASAFEVPKAQGIGTGEAAVIACFILCLLLPLAGWIRLSLGRSGKAN